MSRQDQSLEKWRSLACASRRVAKPPIVNYSCRLERPRRLTGINSENRFTEKAMHSLSRSLIAALLLSATFIMPAGAETTRLTFLLTNDIYRIDNDGPRGGFARLNAVVKAE
eukprot:gene9007-11437_t